MIKRLLLSSLLLLPIAQNAKAQTAQCSQEDWSYIYENREEVINTVVGCYVGCLLNDNLELCLADCMAEAYPEIADSCIACASTQVQCVLDNCTFPCLFPNSVNCQQCVAENCGEAYLSCVGDNDGDGFTVEGGDCNNLDSLINPMEIDIPGDGIDQDCDGEDSLLTALEEQRYPPLLKIFSGRGMLIHLPFDPAELQVFDLTGRELYRRQLAPGDYLIDRSELPAGQQIMIIRLRSREHVLTEKVIF